MAWPSQAEWQFQSQRTAWCQAKKVELRPRRPESWSKDNAWQGGAHSWASATGGGNEGNGQAGRGIQRGGDDAEAQSDFDDLRAFMERGASQPVMMKCDPCEMHGWMNREEQKRLGWGPEELVMFQKRSLLQRLLQTTDDVYDESVSVGKIRDETSWITAVASQNNVINHITTQMWVDKNPHLKSELIWMLHNVDSKTVSQATVVCKRCAAVFKVRGYKAPDANIVARNAEAIRRFFLIPDPKAASLPKQEYTSCMMHGLHGNPYAEEVLEGKADGNLYAAEKHEVQGQTNWHPSFPDFAISKETLYTSLEGRYPGALGGEFLRKDTTELKFYHNNKSKSKYGVLHIMCMRCQTRVQIPDVKASPTETATLHRMAIRLRRYLQLKREGGEAKRPPRQAPGWGDAGGPSTSTVYATAPATPDPYDWEGQKEKPLPRCYHLETEPSDDEEEQSAEQSHWAGGGRGGTWWSSGSGGAAAPDPDPEWRGLHRAECMEAAAEAAGRWSGSGWTQGPAAEAAPSSGWGGGGWPKWADRDEPAARDKPAAHNEPANDEERAKRQADEEPANDEERAKRQAFYERMQRRD